MQRVGILAALALAFVAYCNRARPHSDAPAQPEVTPEPTAACLGPDGQALRFRAYDLAPVGLTFDIIESTDLFGHAITDARLLESERPTANSGWVAQPLSYTTLSVRYGSTATLETWQREIEDYDGSSHVLDHQRSIEVCGRPAKWVEVRDSGSFTQSRREEVGLMPEGGTYSRTEFAREPPRIHVAAAFEHRGLHVLAMWAAPASSEPAYRCIERQFRASIRCR